MPDKVIVKPGSKVTIEIDEESGEAQVKEAAKAAADGLPHGILPGAIQEDTPFRRLGSTIEFEFLDLGVWLRSPVEAADASALITTGDSNPFFIPPGGFKYPTDPTIGGALNEYVPLDAHVAGGGGSRSTPQKQASTFSNNSYTRWSIYVQGIRAQEGIDPAVALIDPATVDPFAYSPAVGSGRLVPNSMPLPYAQAERAGIALTLNNKSYTIGTADKRWKARRAGDTDAQEVWNGLNLAAGVPLTTGRLSIPGTKLDSLLCGSVGYDFWGIGAHGGTQTKVTETCNAQAPDAWETLKGLFKGGRRVRVFLRPKSLWYYFNGYLPSPGCNTVIDGIYGHVGRYPTYPQFSTVQYEFPGEAYGDYHGIFSSFKFIPDSLHRGENSNKFYTTFCSPNPLDPYGVIAGGGDPNALSAARTMPADRYCDTNMSPFFQGVRSGFFRGALEVGAQTPDGVLDPERKLFYIWVWDDFPQTFTVEMVRRHDY